MGIYAENVSVTPQNLILGKREKFKLWLKSRLFFLELFPEFHFISFSIKNVTGCILSFDSPCISQRWCPIIVQSSATSSPLAPSSGSGSALHQGETQPHTRRCSGSHTPLLVTDSWTDIASRIRRAAAVLATIYHSPLFSSIDREICTARNQGPEFRAFLAHFHIYAPRPRKLPLYFCSIPLNERRFTTDLLFVCLQISQRLPRGVWPKTI